MVNVYEAEIYFKKFKNVKFFVTLSVPLIHGSGEY